MTLAAASRDAGHVRAATMPGEGQQRQRGTRRNVPHIRRRPPTDRRARCTWGLPARQCWPARPAGRPAQSPDPGGSGTPTPGSTAPRTRPGCPTGPGRNLECSRFHRQGKQAGCTREAPAGEVFSSKLLCKAGGRPAWLRRAARFYGNRCRRFFA